MKERANILIVDDEEVVRLAHYRSLTRAGFHAEVARDGLEALHAMEQRFYDVVFLDIRMPTLDGITVLREIRRKWPDSEVIIITGYPTIDTAKDAVRLGAYHYLVKPVGPVDVVQAAEDAMNYKSWALRTDPPARPITQLPDGQPWHGTSPTGQTVRKIARQGGTS